MNTARIHGPAPAAAANNDTKELTSDLGSIDHEIGLRDATNGERHVEATEEGDRAHQASSDGFNSAEGEDQQRTEGPIFDLSQCLFCNQMSSDLDTNLAHMSKVHSTIIPEEEHLLVDLGTLLQYLHLVINAYTECIYCGSRRRDAKAAQQHMMAQRHCRFDITDTSSDYRDFYDFELKGLGGEVVDDTTLRLPDGRTLSHRTVHTAKRHTPSNAQNNRLPAGPAMTAASTEDDSGSPSALAPSEAKQLTRAELRNQVLTTQVSSMRQGDRRSLAHLPPPEQRALLATQKRQVEMAGREERRMQGRVQGKGNKGLMKFFKPDVPGRSNG